jgi:hypothetical protein
VVTVEGLQLADTELTDEAGAACTVTADFPDTAGFCVLVAVIVAVSDAAGAVKRPVGLMVPTLADHVTDWLKLPVP